MIELATPREQFISRPERSPAQRRQQQLYQNLGTLARTKGTLEAMARPTCYSGMNNCFVRPTALQQRVINAAAYVLADMMKAAQDEMQNLPSKKKLAAKAKAEKS